MKNDSFLGWPDITIDIELNWNTAFTALTVVVIGFISWMAGEAALDGDVLLAAVLFTVIMLMIAAHLLMKAIALLMVMSEFMQIAAQRDHEAERALWREQEESKLKGIAL